MSWAVPSRFTLHASRKKGMHKPDNERSKHHAAQLKVLGGEAFLLITDGSSGLRVINLRHLISIVPNYTYCGAMMFLQDSTKAISLDLTPEEIIDELSKMEK